MRHRLKPRLAIAKVDVEGSSPFSRSNPSHDEGQAYLRFGLGTY
jgi:hypothetical protein